MYPNSEVHFLAEGTSNHSLGLVIFYQLQHLGPKPFKYFDMRSTDPKFLEVVALNWKKKTHVSLSKEIAQKLQRLRRPLRKLNKEKFSDVQLKYNLAKEKLC